MAKPLSAQERKLYELSKATESKFGVPAPEGKSFLPFQKAGVEYIVSTPNTLLADEPGLGKTIQCAGAINVLGPGRGFILCPASLQLNWKRELDAWLWPRRTSKLFHPTFDMSGADFWIISYYWASQPGVVSALRNERFDFGGIDESHYLKDLKAKRTKYTLAKNGLLQNTKKVVAMTGTAIVNRPIELYPITARLAPHLIGGMSKFSFGLKYCNGWQSPWGWDFTGASNLPELGMRLRSGFMIRRKKAMVLKDLPAKFINVVFLEQSKGAGRVISKMASYETPGELIDYSIAFTELSEARRELGEEKVKPAADYILTQLDAGHEKIFVVAHHRSVIAGLEDALAKKKIGVTKLVGDMTVKEKQESVDRFQTDKSVRVMLGSSAAREGHTLTAASYVILVEFSWVPGENEQIMDRVHRIGQTENVLVDFLVFEGSLDEKVLKYNLEKTKNTREFYE